MFKDDTLNILAEPIRKLVCPDCEHEIDVSGLAMLSPVDCPKCRVSLKVPARLGDFILVEALGAGGMATVYKAYDSSLGRYVAIKIMRRKFGEDPKFVERFLREARAAARINHPNVVQIYSCATRKGQPYIVMEYVDGGKFDEIIASSAPLAESRVLDIAIDVANGLRAASDIGLVHGDIKPANIIFGKNGLAKVADFGLAHFAQEEEDRTEIWGTPYYIAPERARKKGQDHRADIYCLGATLFHALTGKPPFDGETAVDVVMARLQAPAPDVGALAPDVGEQTCRIIARMLELETFKRYPNYNSLISDIEKAKEYHAAGPRSSGGGKAAKRKTGTVVGKSTAPKKGGGPKPKIIFAALVAGLAVAGLLLLPRFLRTDADPESRPTAAVEVSDHEKPEELPMAFARQDGQRIADILNGLNSTTASETQEQLSALADSLSDKPMALRWTELLRAVATNLQGEREQSANHYRSVLAVKEDGIDNIAYDLAAAIAEFMLGEKDSIEVDYTRDWQRWHGDISIFFQGFKALADSEPEMALRLLDQFSGISPSRPILWPYSLQTLSRDLATRIRGWNRLSSEIDDLKNQQLFDEAIGRLERVRSELFIPLREAKLKEIETFQRDFEAQRATRDEETDRLAREQAEQERQQRFQEEQSAKLAAETRLLTEYEERTKPLLQSNQFEDARRDLEQLGRQIDTDEGKAKFEIKLLENEYLNNLKTFIISSINRNPYRRARDILRGDAILASRNELTIELPGGIGTSELEWSQVTPRLLVPMVQHYLQETRLDDPEKARIFMGMAAYANLHGLRNQNFFIRNAEDLSPGIASEIGMEIQD